MKLFIFFIFLAAFAQTSFITLNLCLIILISRSYAINDAKNYYLALFGGILVGVLTSLNIGFYPLIFIVSVFLVHLIRTLPITGKYWIILPISFGLLMMAMLTEYQVYNFKINWWLPSIGSLVTLPIYIFIREWEERFVAKPGIRLKL
jgi:hypothetical protein